ncbi:protein CEBPZOS-like [Glandiceps talaboti]
MVINIDPHKFRRGIRVVLAAEAVVFFGAYYVFHKMNTNQDYRQKMHTKHPMVLEAFYKSAEWGGIKDTRQNDYKAWGITDK